MLSRPTHHTIVAQADPEQHVAGGIQGFVRDLIRYGGSDRRFTLIGVTHDRDRPLGLPAAVNVGGPQPVEFLPVARVPGADGRRRVPHTARLVAGFLRWRLPLQADVVHFHRAEAALACATFVANAPVVLFLHGAGQAHRWGVGGESFWSLAPGAAYDWVERSAIRRADRTYIMDRAHAESRRQTFATVSAARNWYDGSVFSGTSAQSPSDGLVVGWVGRFQDSKDPLLAVRVFAALAAAGNKFDAWMAGNGPLRPTVERELRATGLSTVRLLGLLTPRELAAQFRSTTVCLATSRWEGIPRAVIEALACGVPVVCTDVGDVRSLVHPDNGVLLTERDPAAFASAIDRVPVDRDRAMISTTVAHLEAKRMVPALLSEIESDVLVR